MDYLKGKELFDVIRDIGILNKNEAQFYIGSIMLAVQYLHERKFLFRDIKPENIMVLENGYIKLIDFGTAKEIKDKTKTIIGTPQYMAPEVILGELYSFEIDFWSIGICLYEFCCGCLPFGENEEDPTNIYVSVINK
jgi:cGMP-dependent protein kinase